MNNKTDDAHSISQNDKNKSKVRTQKNAKAQQIINAENVEDIIQIRDIQINGNVKKLLLKGTPKPERNSSERNPNKNNNKEKVFLVHGHAENEKSLVARFIEKLDIESIILNEKIVGCSTIIEKLEKYSNVKFAIIILTPDDLGSSKELFNQSRPRARQNVIFEFGYFLGKLGRKKVCSLRKGDIEIPSDLSGIEYIEMNSKNDWKLKVAQALKNASFKIDLNKLI